MVVIQQHLSHLSPFADTCHFQKLNEENTCSEFDFNWNSSPQTVICAFPYVIAFTNETMEIRLLVNGNLVHMATMAELKLITNKKDIFFSTTAPEFIPRSSRIKGLEYDESPTATNGDSNHTPTHQKVYPKINDISDEKIMEIKSKIEKIEAKTTNAESVESNESQESQDEYNNHQNEVLINQKDNLNRLVVADDLPAIQRARSLQGKDNRYRESLEEKRRQISKSNSCGESTITTNGALTPTATGHVKATEPSVPPNSPKVKDVVVVQGSPNSKSRLQQNQQKHDCEGSPGKVKPLRIYKIPLSNLIGTSQHHNHQHHTHHSNNLHNNFTNPTKIQSSKITEDHSEDSDSLNRAKADELL